MNLAELKAQHAIEIANLETEQKIAELFPQATLVCVHSAFISVQIGDNYKPTRTKEEALEIARTFFPEVVTSEVWKGSCTSVRPLEVNSTAKDERSTLQFSAFASIELTGGIGFGPDAELTLWVRRGGFLVKVSIPFHCPELNPRVYNKVFEEGQCVSASVQWNANHSAADNLIKYWSTPRSYHGICYCADSANFEAWLLSVC